MAKSANSSWWQHGIAYQIYVRSWRDSDGDGIGDLAGVGQRLDYLESLGVDAIWLSPTMPSPDTDWGYDVADYCAVHPDLGTSSDLDRLILEAGEHNIAVFLDIVPNHTSSQHRWFLDALSGPNAKYRDYYIWADPKPDGSPPNNWTNYPGDPAWTFDEKSGQYYLHSFLPSQPDLNWRNEAVHREFDQILNYWFERGIAGFRIDSANALYKDALLRDDPPADPEATAKGEEAVIYSTRGPEAHQVYQHWRQIADSYEPGRVLLGEAWETDYERLAGWYGRDSPELHMDFNLPFILAPLRARELASVVEATLAALPPDATPVWTASNHDMGRLASRWCQGDRRAVKTALVLLATLPGTVVLYQGDELGLTDVDVPAAQRRDQMSLAMPDQPSRDRCRTPMPWSREPDAGFTDGPGIPWLPLGSHDTVNVEDEAADPHSTLNFWRTLAALRSTHRLGAGGPATTLLLDDQVWCYRVGGTITMLNLSAEPSTRSLQGNAAHPVLAATDPAWQRSEVVDEVELGPWQALVVEVPRDGR